MSKGGRPPKSLEQHKAEGTLRRDRHKVVPLLVGGRRKPACPRFLTGSARTAYRMIVNDLWDSGILDAGDRLLVATAAMHFASAMDAQAAVARLGQLYPVTRGARDGSPGYKVLEANPATRIHRDSLIEFRQCCDLLGIGPAARARLSSLGVRGKDIHESVPGLAQICAVGDGLMPPTRMKQSGQ